MTILVAIPYARTLLRSVALELDIAVGTWKQWVQLAVIDVGDASGAISVVAAEVTRV